ncbi:MAG: transporter substrate-binding domain-containing protein [Planctomycetaceae bacterium]|nr:transporter substrate-binding domain-containing protein [Planctomycetaceae bacterium]
MAFRRLCQRLVFALAALASAIWTAGAPAQTGDAPLPEGRGGAVSATDSRDAGPCVLRAAVADFPPFATPAAGGAWTGDTVELFRATAHDIACDVEFIPLSGPEILRALEREEIDAVALPFSANPLSSTMMTLTPSFTTSTLRIAVFRENLRGDISILLRSLTTPRQLQVYGAMLTLVVLFAILIWAFERSHNAHFRGRRHEGIGSGLWWSITTLSTVGYGDKVPVSAAGRLFAGLWMVLSLILVAIFTATITSSITAHDTSIEVGGVHDLPRSRVGIVENGLANGYMNDHFLPHISYPHLPAAVDDLRQGNLDAVVADEHALLRVLAVEDKDRIKLLEQPVEKSPVSFGFRKSLPKDLVRRFNQALVARIERRPYPIPAADAGPPGAPRP